VVAFFPASPGALPEYNGVAHEVRELSRPTERIFVWGQFPQAYWASNRLPATRFPHVEFLTGIGGGRNGPTPYVDVAAGTWPMLWSDLRHTRAKLIVDASTLDGNGHMYPIGTSPLGPFVKRHYRPVERVDGVTIWEWRR
jgi:hypothetical protein